MSLKIFHDQYKNIAQNILKFSTTLLNSTHFEVINLKIGSQHGMHPNKDTCKKYLIQRLDIQFYKLKDTQNKYKVYN